MNVIKWESHILITSFLFIWSLPKQLYFHNLPLFYLIYTFLNVLEVICIILYSMKYSRSHSYLPPRASSVHAETDIGKKAWSSQLSSLFFCSYSGSLGSIPSMKKAWKGRSMEGEGNGRAGEWKKRTLLYYLFL